MTLTSGNTFGAVVWTDGKRIAPMLPLPPTVVKCHGCAECYWLSDAKEVGTVHRWSAEGKRVDPAWTAAPEVQEPTEDEYYEALRKGLAADTQQEIILRILAWWRRNDEFRDTPQREPASIVTGSEAWRENALALVRLLDEMADHDRLMKAEVLRELGEFESAQEILGRVTSVDYAPVVGQLRSLCEARDAFVRQLEFGS
jgi:hypothetical protein